MDEDNFSQDDGSLEQGQGIGTEMKSATKDVTKKGAKKLVKNFEKNLKKKNAKAFETIAKIASKLAPILPYILIALIIIICLAGLIGFIQLMPGMIPGKIRELGQSVSDWWQSLYEGEAYAIVNDDDIIQTADYVEDMGFELIGYGFIPANTGISKDVVEAGQEMNDYGVIYQTQGDETGAVGTFETNGTVVGFDNEVDTSIFRTYLMADRRLFIIRNFDYTDANIINKIHDLFVAAKSRWANGLISLYNAVEGKATSKYKRTDAGSIKVNPETATMEIKGSAMSNPVSYSMDGWTGRYGLSLEFLLSLHVAVMSPELVTTMARTFDTEIQVYLDELESEVTGYFRTDSSKDITWEDLEGITGGVISNENATAAMKEFGIKSKTEGEFKCEGGLEEKNLGTDLEQVNILMYDNDKTKITDYISWQELQDGSDNGDVLNKDNMGLFIQALNNKLVEIGQTSSKLSGITTSNFATQLQNVIPFSEMSQLQSNNGNDAASKDYVIDTWNISVDGEASTLKLIIEARKQNLGGGNDIGFVVKARRTFTESERAEFDDPDNPVCSDHLEEPGFEVCTKCEKYVEAIRDSLKKINDEKFKTSVPYIARVVDSWFRDTYFIVPQDTDVAIDYLYNDKTNSIYYGANGRKLTAGNVKTIKMDDEYFKDTGEYWTSYEVDDNGDYVLYEVNSDGTLGDKWTGTEEEAELTGIQLAKKANTEAVNSAWNAYKFDAKTNEQKHILEVNDSSTEDIKYVTDYDSATGSNNERLYYSVKETRTVEQIEDGKRGETNEIVKKMFKKRKYYMYDGTAERAEAIYKDWQAVISGKNEAEVEKAIDDFYYGTSTSTLSYTKDPRDPGLIGNISINKDSLSAFSILENTHTLDADYAYRDFKELIVELNYFDKEELTEKPIEVFEWLYPELPSGAWPKRSFDKSEEFYGTLIHSSEMYNELMEQEGRKAVENTNRQNETEDAGVTKADSSNPTTVTVSGNYLEDLKAKAQEIAEYCTSKGYTYNAAVPSNSEEITALRNYSSVSCAAGALWVLAETSPTDLAPLINSMASKGYNFRSSYMTLDFFQEQTTFPVEQVTDQSQLQPGDLVVWDYEHTQLYLGDDLWFNSGGKDPVVSCSTYDAVKHFYNQWGKYPYAIHISGVSSGGSGGTTATPFDGYKEGNAVVSPITGEILEIGATKITNEAVENTETTYNVDYIKIKVLTKADLDLLESTLKGLSKEYESEYEEKGETKTLKKTYNAYEAYSDFYDDYKDAFKKVKVKKEDYNEEYILTISGFKGLATDLSELYNIINAAQPTPGSTTGEDGGTIKITIEEAEVDSVTEVETPEPVTPVEPAEPATPEEETESLVGTEVEFKINNYTKKETPNLIDNEKEAEFSTLEDAKDEAPCIIKSGNRYFIKAGTIIGYTTKANMKLLFRDGKNAIIENIEDYIELDDELLGANGAQGGTNISTEVSEQYLAWHVQTYGKLAVPACGSPWENYGYVDGSGVRYEYTNDDTGYVPNLMPELAMIPGSNNVKHLSELGYDANKLTSFSYVMAYPVKLDDVLDTYMLYINNAISDIKSRVGKDLEQKQLDALVETYIWGPAYTHKLCDILKTRELTQADFMGLDLYGDPTNAAKRQEIAWKIYNEWKFINPYDMSQKAEFMSETPFTAMAIEYKELDGVFKWVSDT